VDLTNQTLTTFLGSSVNKSLKDWALKLSHAEFAYNRASSYGTLHSHFEYAYGVFPLILINFQPFPTESIVSYDAKVRTKEMKGLHDHRSMLRRKMKLTM